MAKNGKQDDGGSAWGWVVGGVVGLAVLVGGGFGIAAFMKRGDALKKKDDDDEEDEPKKKAEPKTTDLGTKVPAKGQTPFNLELFSTSGETTGRLMGMAPKYATASVNATERKKSFKLYQGDWNALAKKKKLTPSKLNKSRLTIDGKPGAQTKRAMEHSLAMNWHDKLTAAGRLTA